MPTFETDQPIVLSIEMSRGAVHVIVSDRTDTVVAVNPRDRYRQKTSSRPKDRRRPGQRDPLDRGAEPARHRRTSRTEARRLRRGDCGAPGRSSPRADADFADVRCDGRLDDVEVRTGAGDVRLDQTGVLRVRTSTGHVAVEEASDRAEIVAAGDMTIGVVAGDADVKDLNGKTWIGRVGGDVRVRSASGDVMIEEAGRDVTVKTANGNIRLGQVARGSATIETASGGLEIGVRAGTAAWIDTATRFGRVHNNLTSRRPRTVSRDRPGSRPHPIRRRPDRTL